MYDDLVKRLRAHNGWALNETLDEAADAIEVLSKPRWIPVTERVPEELEDVLCCTDEGYIVLGWLVENPKITTTGYECASSAGFVRNITHWMPLPEPPEEVTQDD